MTGLIYRNSARAGSFCCGSFLVMSIYSPMQKTTVNPMQTIAAKLQTKHVTGYYRFYLV